MCLNCTVTAGCSQTACHLHYLQCSKLTTRVQAAPTDLIETGFHFMSSPVILGQLCNEVFGLNWLSCPLCCSSVDVMFWSPRFTQKKQHVKHINSYFSMFILSSVCVWSLWLPFVWDYRSLNFDLLTVFLMGQSVSCFSSGDAMVTHSHDVSVTWATSQVGQGTVMWTIQAAGVWGGRTKGHKEGIETQATVKQRQWQTLEAQTLMNDSLS